MIKQGDAVTISRLETTRRQRTKLDPPDQEWIDSKPKTVKSKGVIASLHALNVVVNLPGGDYRGSKYVDLTHLKGGKVSFKSRLPSWKGIKADKEVLLPGKEITVKGVINWNRVFIPVVIKGKTCQIPYEQLKFKKETK